MNAAKWILFLALSAISGTATFTDDFRRGHTYSTTPGHNGWTIKDTSAAGTPTYVNGQNGFTATLASNSESEIVTLYQNDIKCYDCADILSIEWDVSVSGVDSVTQVVFGVASSQNDTPDSVTQNAWFKIAGADSTSNIVCETDDNTTDNDDKATGTTLSSTIKRCVISFRQGLSDVRFSVNGARVASATTFNMSAIAANTQFQPFVQIQKASGTGTPSVTVRQCEIKYRYNF